MDHHEKHAQDAASDKRDVARKRNFDRIVLCESMFGFVQCVVKNHYDNASAFHEKIHVFTGVVKCDYSTIYFPPRTAKLFETLKVHAQQDENGKTIVFSLESIYLAGSHEKIQERGAGLLYAILQGLKIGIVCYQSTADFYGKELILKVAAPETGTTLKYLTHKEGFPNKLNDAVQNGKNMVESCSWKLSPCKTRKSWYWSLGAEFKRMANGNILQNQNAELTRREKNFFRDKWHAPLVTSGRVIFCSESEIAFTIAEQVCSLMYNDFMYPQLYDLGKKNENSMGEAVEETFQANALVQAVFKSLQVQGFIEKSRQRDVDLPSIYNHDVDQVQVSKYNMRFSVIMTYNNPFRWIDLLPHVMHFLLIRYNRSLNDFGDMLIQSVTVQQTNALDGSLQSMTHELLALYNDSPDCSNMTNLKMGQLSCVRCMGLIKF